MIERERIAELERELEYANENLAQAEEERDAVDFSKLKQDMAKYEAEQYDEKELAIAAYNSTINCINHLIEQGHLKCKENAAPKIDGLEEAISDFIAVEESNYIDEYNLLNSDTFNILIKAAKAYLERMNKDGKTT